MIFLPTNLSLRDQCLLKISMSMWTSETALEAMAKEIPEIKIRPRNSLHPTNIFRRLRALIRFKRQDLSKYVSDWDMEWDYRLDTVLQEPLKDWCKVTRRVEANVAKLPIPNHLRKKLLKYIEPIGSRVKKWFQTWVKLIGKDGKRLCKFNQTTLYAINENRLRAYFAEIKWVKGQIDKASTAIMVVDDAGIDIVARHRVATVYCMEDKIPTLRKQIEKRLPNYSHQGHFLFQAYWPYYTDSRSHRNEETYVIAFQIAIILGKEVAVKNYWNLLKRFEQETIVRDMVQNVDTHYHAYKYPEIMDFLLSILNEEQRYQYLKPDFATEDKVTRPFAELLQYPYQHYFTKFASYMWEYMPASRYYKLMESLLEVVTTKGLVSVYADELNHFWQESPLKFKLIYLVAKTYAVMLRKLTEDDFVSTFKLDSKRVKIEHLLENEDLVTLFNDGVTTYEQNTMTGADLVKDVIKYCLDIHTVGYLMYHVENCFEHLTNLKPSAILSRLNWLVYGKDILYAYIKNITNSTFEISYENNSSQWEHKNCTICDKIVEK